MTSGISKTWLKKIDKCMGCKGQNVFLFLDNAMSHSDVQLCNVKFNTTSTTNQYNFLLQPLDQAIILAMKQKYGKRQL